MDKYKEEMTQRVIRLALTELGQKGDVVLQETSLDKGKNSAHAEKPK